MMGGTSRSAITVIAKQVGLNDFNSNRWSKTKYI
jgi:hypothetical protein